MFLKCSSHLLYCPMIIHTIKGKIEAELSSFLTSLGAPKIRLDGVDSGFFKMQCVNEEMCSWMPSYSRLECARATGPGGQQSGAGVGGLQVMEVVVDCSVQSLPSSDAWGAGSYPASVPWLPLRAAVSARTVVLPGLWQSVFGCSLHPAYILHGSEKQIDSTERNEIWESSRVLLAPMQKL